MIDAPRPGISHATHTPFPSCWVPSTGSIDRAAEMQAQNLAGSWLAAGGEIGWLKGWIYPFLPRPALITLNLAMTARCRKPYTWTYWDYSAPRPGRDHQQLPQLFNDRIQRCFPALQPTAHQSVCGFRAWKDTLHRCFNMAQITRCRLVTPSPYRGTVWPGHRASGEG